MGRARNLGVWGQRIAIGAVLALVVGFAVRVGSSSSQSLDYRDPLIWLVSAATGEVVQADSGSGEVTARVSVGEDGDSLQVVQRGADAFVLNRTAHTVGRIDGSSLEVDEQLPVEVDDTARLLARGEHAGIVTDTAMIPLDPNAHPMAAVDAPGLSGAVLDAQGTVWGLDGARALVAVTDTANPVPTPTDTRPFGLVATADDAYLLDGSGPALMELDGSGPKLGETKCVGGQIGPNSVVGGSVEAATSVVVMVDADTGVVRMSDLVSGTCTGVTLTGVAGATFGSPVESGGYAYIPVPTTGEIVVVRVVDGSLVRRHTVVRSAGQIELEVKDGVVWFNAPNGPEAGVIDPDGVREIDKYRQLEVGGIVEEPDPQPDTSSTGGDGGEGGDDVDTTGSDGTEQSPDEGTDPGDGTSNSAGSPQRTTGSDGLDDGPVEDRDLTGLVADFTYSKRVVEVGEVVSFVDRSHGGPTAWTWEFGDGSFSTGPRAEHAWSEIGAYTVTLRIETATGTAAASVTIEVIDENTKSRPDADFLYSASRVEVGQSIEFTSRTTGNPTSLEWDFGDGNLAEGESVEHSWESAGTYMVELTATNALGSDTSDAIAVTVFDRVDQPEAVISAGATSANVNQTITFQSRSTGNPTEIRWGFGDGATARGESVSHAWTAPGDYTVELFVSNSAGESSTTVDISIEEVVVKPIARIDASTRAAQIGQQVRFTSLSVNNPTRLSWDFGDGTTDVGSAVDHAFSRAGTFTVKLRASNAAGESETTVPITVTVDVPLPVAGFTSSPESPVSAGVPVQFADQSGGGSVTRWRWDFGDGTPTSSQRNPAHVFATAGTFTVRLTVENSAGTDDLTRQIVVRPPRPEASFTYSPVLPNAGDPVQFSDTTRGGTPTSWTWDFGDGSTSTDQNPRHAFAAQRSYSVTLTVRNEGGSTTTTRLVEVNPAAPVAAFTVTPATGVTTATPVRFNYRPTAGAGEPASYQWDFGNGESASAPNPRAITYAAAGDYRVRLTVVNAGGTNSSEQIVTVTVPPPVASFAVGPTRVAGQPVSFTNTSTGVPFDSVTWDWDDGSAPGTADSPSHTFADAGNYRVRLTVVNGGGTQTTVETVRIFAQPTASITGPTDTVVAGTATALTASISGGQATWTVDGAVVGTGASVSHAFPAAGNYLVAVTVTNAGGGVAQDSRGVMVVVEAPVAEFGYAPVPDSPGLFQFSNLSSGGPFDEGQVTWDFGDGSAAATGNTVTHQFTAPSPPGGYDVTVTVVNATGADSRTRRVAVPAPEPGFTFEATENAGEFLFTNTSTGGPFVVEWLWDDGTDPQESPGPIRHTFEPALLPYFVRVRVTNGLGTFTSDPQAVMVSPFG